jgi:asparagine synthase (glutamine-hydrolysing)
MCGIAGLVGPGAANHVERVASMIAALQHRGPDEHGLAVFDEAVLGNARLSIIDPAGGRQPLYGPGRRTALVCNGEIYGHHRIRAQHPEYPFTTGSDCEVALTLYHAHGDRFLPHLPGTFALALWDDQRRTLHLARDRFGERPLYYATTDDGLLAFASESRALRIAGFGGVSPDPAMVAEMLRQGYVPSGRSIWSDVMGVPHASRLTLRPDEPPMVERWWTAPEVGPDVADDEAARWLRQELDRAVRDQLEADVPLGTFLSGGIDSTTIAALAARHHPHIHAFTFDMPGDSELRFAQETAELHGMTLHALRPDVDAIVDLIADLPSAWDEPFGDSSAVPTRLLSEFARDHVKVALTGDGADELLGGYLVWARGMLTPGTPGAPAAASAGAEAPNVGTTDRLRRLLGRVGRSKPTSGTDTGSEVARRYAAFRQYFDATELERLGLPGTDARDVDVAAYRYGTADDICRFDLDHYLPGDILVKTDRASMAHGLEVRSPFLDVRVAEGCLALPARHKVDGTHEKLLLRRAFRDLWPDSVATRAKQGFGSPMAQWLALPAVAELKRAHLSDPRSALFDLVDHAATQPYVDRNDQQTWNLLMLSIWWTSCRAKAVSP